MSGPRKEDERETFKIPSARPQVTEILGLDKLDEVLRRVPLTKAFIERPPYEYACITLEELRVDQLHPTARYILNDHLRVQGALREALLSQGIDTLAMEPAHAIVRYKWGDAENVIVPPLIEISSWDEYNPLILDGLHRVTLAKNLGKQEISGVVIKNSSDPLTAVPIDWSEVQETDHVPPLSQKRKLRFPTTETLLRYYEGFRYPPKINVPTDETKVAFSYIALFRDLDIKGLLDWPFAIPKTELPGFYHYAGVLVTNPDLSKVLLGNQKVAPTLWGNFAGRRESGETDPAMTAIRELREEAGITVDDATSFRGSVTVIKKRTNGNHRAGVSFNLPIDERQKVVPPPESEVESVRWFTPNQVFELMDECRPDLQLWGGAYTVKVLEEWMETRRTGKPANVITQIDSWWLGETPFDALKKLEKDSSL